MPSQSCCCPGSRPKLAFADPKRTIYYACMCIYIYIYVCVCVHINVNIYIYKWLYIRYSSVLGPNPGQLEVPLSTPCQCTSIQTIFRHLWQEKHPSSKMFQSLWFCGMCCGTLCAGQRLGERLREWLGEWECGRHGCRAPALDRF